MTVILIVEDDEELLNLYVETLEINRFSVQTAIDGEEAISKYKQIRPDLVVMDGILPKMDGYDAFSQIIEFDKNAKVVIVTGYSEFYEKNKLALEQGLISVISKPIGVDELLNLAKRYCERSEDKNSTSNPDLERSIS